MYQFVECVLKEILVCEGTENILHQCTYNCGNFLLIDAPVVNHSRDHFDLLKVKATNANTGMVDYMSIAESEKYPHFQEVSLKTIPLMHQYLYQHDT